MRNCTEVRYAHSHPRKRHNGGFGGSLGFQSYGFTHPNQRASLVPQPLLKLQHGIAMPFNPAKRTMVETVPAIDQLAIGLISNFCGHRSGSDRASLSSRTMSHSLTCGAAVQSPRVFRNRDHELLSIPHTSSTRYTASGWKRAVCRRNSTVCNLPKIQRKRARGKIRCHRG